MKFKHIVYVKLKSLIVIFKTTIMSSTSTKVILGIVGAAAAGAVIGMLVAPEKGSEMRKRVKDTANDWACQLADLFAEQKENLQNLRVKATRSAKEMKNEGEERFNSVKESLS